MRHKNNAWRWGKEQLCKSWEYIIQLLLKQTESREFHFYSFSSFFGPDLNSRLRPIKLICTLVVIEMQIPPRIPIWRGVFPHFKKLNSEKDNSAHTNTLLIKLRLWTRVCVLCISADFIAWTFPCCYAIDWTQIMILHSRFFICPIHSYTVDSKPEPLFYTLCHLVQFSIKK